MRSRKAVSYLVPHPTATAALASGGCSLSTIIWTGFRLKREMLDLHQ
jgi:hypothetical protein